MAMYKFTEQTPRLAICTFGESLGRKEGMCVMLTAMA